MRIGMVLNYSGGFAETVSQASNAISGTLQAVATQDPTILVVVPDRDVRTLVGHMLEGSRYRVLLAAGVAQAIAAQGSTEIDLLVTEVAPSVDGFAIAEQLRACTPGLPVLYIGGWFDHPRYAELKQETVVSQPFSRSELMHAIDSVLEQRRSTGRQRAAQP